MDYDSLYQEPMRWAEHDPLPREYPPPSAVGGVLVSSTSRPGRWMLCMLEIAGGVWHFAEAQRTYDSAQDAYVAMMALKMRGYSILLEEVQWMCRRAQEEAGNGRN